MGGGVEKGADGRADARSLHHCEVARGYNARVRAAEGPVTAGYGRPASQFGNNNEKRAAMKKKGDVEQKRGERKEGRKKIYCRDVIKAEGHDIFYSSRQIV